MGRIQTFQWFSLFKVVECQSMATSVVADRQSAQHYKTLRKFAKSSTKIVREPLTTIVRSSGLVMEPGTNL